MWQCVDGDWLEWNNEEGMLCSDKQEFVGRKEMTSLKNDCVGG